MEQSTQWLFHLHFNTNDLGTAESTLQDAGLPLTQRFGFVDGELEAIDPEESIPPAWRFYVEILQRGYTNITLGRGGAFRFDHLGVVTTQFEDILERAEAHGWGIQYPEGRRTFLHTPWGFRIEVHPEGNEVEAELGAWNTSHFDEIVLVVEDATRVQDGIESVIGVIPGLRISEASVDRPTVEQFTIGGDAFHESVTVPISTLHGGSDD